MPTAPNITIGIKEKGANKVAQSFNKLSAATEKNERSVASLRKEQARQAKAERIQAARRKRQIAQWTRYGKAVAAAAAAIVGREVITNTLEFETQMNRVAAVSGATGKALENLSAQARNLGSETKFAASEVAAGQAFLGQAGFKTNEILAATPALLDLAAAGMLDLAEASDIASNIMGAFQIAAGDAADVADVLAAVAASSNTNIQQLGEAVSYVGPVAYSAGLSLRDVAAAVGILGNNGIQASRAGTSLNTIFSKLLKPTADAEAIFKKYNVQLRDSEGNLRDFIDILRELHAAGAPTEDFFTIFGQRGAPAALIFAALSEQGAKYRDTLDDVDGASSKMADTMETGLVGAIHNLKSAWEGLTISMGKNPIFNALVLKPIEILTATVRAFTPELEQQGLTVEELGKQYETATKQIAKMEKELEELEGVGGRRAENQRATLRKRIEALKEESFETSTLAGIKLRIAEIDEQINNPTYRKAVDRLRKEKASLEAQVAEIEAAAYKARQQVSEEDERAPAGRRSPQTSLRALGPSPEAILKGNAAWADFFGGITDQARMTSDDVKTVMDGLVGYVPSVSGTRQQKLSESIDAEIARIGAQQARLQAAIVGFGGPGDQDLPEYIAKTDGWVKRLGKSFEDMGTKASDSLKAIIVNGADATETVKRLLLTLGVDFLTSAFEPGGFFRPIKKNVGGTIFPGQAYRVHEDETIVPVGSPMQVQPARAGGAMAGTEVVNNIVIEGYDRDEAALAAQVARAVEQSMSRREARRSLYKRDG